MASIEEIEDGLTHHGHAWALERMKEGKVVALREYPGTFWVLSTKDNKVHLAYHEDGRIINRSYSPDVWIGLEEGYPELIFYVIDKP